MRVEVENQQQVADFMRRFGERAQAAIGDAIKAAGMEARTKAVELIQRGPATGRVYEKYLPRRTHQASAPGQAPATDTGRLAASIAFRMESSLVALVVSNVEYAPWLEYGTQRMQPRPFMGPAAQSVRTSLDRRIKAAIDRVAR